MSTAEFLAPSYIVSFRSRRRRHQTPPATVRDPALSAAPRVPLTRTCVSSTPRPRDSTSDDATGDPPALPSESPSVANTSSSPSSSSLLLEGARAGFASAAQVAGSSSSSKKLTSVRSDCMEPTSSRDNCVGYGQQDCSSSTRDQSSSDEQCTQSRYSMGERMLSAIAPEPQPQCSSTPHQTSIRKHPMEEVDIQDCAICLDKIQPRQHAQAILACRHEFHLSCISMAFAVGNEMVCPLCRYLHKDQPFMNQESEEGVKLASPHSRRSFPSTVSTSTSTSRATSPHHRHTFSDRRRSSHSIATLHEHPTSGTVLSMMPSLFETTLGHGPAAGTIRTAPDGIFLKTSTWLLLYAMPFTVALCFLSFVLGKVETMWSKISCLIGAAICYMVCWAFVVAVMNPDHEARAILERLNQFQETVDGTTRSSSLRPQDQALGPPAMQVRDSAEVRTMPPQQ
ncbi:unnamed protein product [Mortierella alpina]